MSADEGVPTKAAAEPPRKPCPICQKPSVAAYAPFCSGRCRNVDLGRWLTGRYAVPTEEPPEDEGDGLR